MYSDKEIVNRLVALLAAKGVHHVLISPGSRNAPLIKSLTAHPDIHCHSIVDERSAGYYALGMSLSLKAPVALTCTSGTAMLNYTPALSEAFYQRVPLLALTADRPEELIDQREGQAIRQRGAYSNFIKFEATLPQEPLDEDLLWQGERLIAEAINQAVTPAKGPVHLNIPLREPLYGEKASIDQAKNIEMNFAEKQLSRSEIIKLATAWSKAQKVMILTGVLSPDKALEEQLVKAAETNNTVVLTERTSNLSHPDFHHYIDRSLNTMPANDVEAYKPDLLITIGADVVSKQIKAFLRTHKPKNHWHIDDGKQHTDTYKSLTHVVPVSPLIFLQSVLPHLKPVTSGFSDTWNGLESCGQRVHEDFLSNADWSDLVVFKNLMKDIPAPGILHLGNSTPVRYAMLFAPKKGLKYLANRGTSGIDGIVSTAAGYALQSDQINTVITGDVSFFYDSNALWNKNLPNNLRIVVINNQGGSIFRIIPGPASTDQMEEYFETKQDFQIKKMAAVFGLTYYFCDEQSKWEAVLKKIYQPHNSSVILEIKTPGHKNDKVLKNYFKHLKAE